jgi:D-glycero-D-manno-heptose 1,7-bisphosphate phosphatase
MSDTVRTTQHASRNTRPTPNVGHASRNTEYEIRNTQYAALLDRDGTIVREKGYLGRPEELELLPGAVEGLRQLRAAGYRLVVLTNQAGVARGYYGEADVLAVHERLREMLRVEGVELDAIYYCPHHPEGQGVYRRACPNRKPGTGMHRQAQRDLGLDLARCVVIGDKVSDLLPGIALGCRTAMLRTGHGQAQIDAGETEGLPIDHIADDLLAAVEWILSQE